MNRTDVKSADHDLQTALIMASQGTIEAREAIDFFHDWAMDSKKKLSLKEYQDIRAYNENKVFDYVCKKAISEGVAFDYVRDTMDSLSSIFTVNARSFETGRPSILVNRAPESQLECMLTADCPTDEKVRNVAFYLERIHDTKDTSRYTEERLAARKWYSQLTDWNVMDSGLNFHEVRDLVHKLNGFLDAKYAVKKQDFAEMCKEPKYSPHVAPEIAEGYMMPSVARAVEKPKGILGSIRSGMKRLYSSMFPVREVEYAPERTF